MVGGQSQILILGGYGLAGQPIARWLLDYTPVSVIIAGRRGDQAEKLAAELNQRYPGRVRGICADGSDPASLKAAFRDITLVIDCMPTTAHVSTVTRAALDAGVDYLDILFGPNKLDLLNALKPEIEQSGRCFITEAGYHPGLIAAFVRYAAARLDTVDTALVGGLLNFPLPYTPAVDDLVRELDHFQMIEYKDGAWRTTTKYRQFDFGARHGIKSCYPMDFYELHGLPEKMGLREMGFYMASMNWFADNLIFMPWYIFKLGRFDWGARLGAKLLVWSTEKFTRKPYEVILKLDAAGCLDNQPVRLEFTAQHPDGYIFTAIPVVACILQYLDGSINKPGLHIMGQAVEPLRLMRDMEHMGIEIQERLTQPASITS